MRRAITLLILAAALPAGGCGGGGNDESSLPDGRHYGYIESIDRSSAPATISIDTADFLTGEAANRAAVEDGFIQEGESVPNDYYVRNPDTAVAVVPVADDVRVTRVHCPAGCEEGAPGRFDDLAESFLDPEPKTLEDEYRGADSQYWVSVEDGEVVSIDEQYLP